MHFTNAVFTVLVGVVPLLARADDLELERSDIPAPCTSICEPIRQLAQICDVDDDRIRNDRTEDLLNLQCVCTNRSFDVARFAGLCQSCMAQNTRDRGNLDDIDEIMRKCGFASQSYAPSQSNAATGINVQATRPTDSAQLTTTFVPGNGAGGATPGPTTRSSGAPGTPGTPGTPVPSGTRPASGITASTGTTSRPTGTNTSANTPGSMAPATLPQGGLLTLGMAAAAVFGTMIML